jgi:hypothetical protein
MDPLVAAREFVQGATSAPAAAPRPSRFSQMPDEPRIWRDDDPPAYREALDTYFQVLNEMRREVDQ